MQYFDTKKLESFYSTSKGERACNLIASHIKPIISQTTKKIAQARLMGYGFCQPFFANMQDCIANSQVFILHPHHCGAWHYLTKDSASGEKDRPQKLNASALIDEKQLPLQNDTIDMICVINALEFSPNSDKLIAELARILVPMGQILILLPNKWPAGLAPATAKNQQGQKITRIKLKRILAENKLVLKSCQTLEYAQTEYQPREPNKDSNKEPKNEQPKLTKIIEKSAHALLPNLHGVTLYQAQKIVTGKINKKSILDIIQPLPANAIPTTS